MFCDYCFVVRNLEPGFCGTASGFTFPSTSIFFRPYENTFTFGPTQMSAEHVHVNVPTQTLSSFSGMDGDFLVNSDKRFLIFSPRKPELTYGEVLLPSDETHSLIVPVANTHHKIRPGSVIVGIDSSRPKFFVCFVHFMNGSETIGTMPVHDLVLNSTRVINYFQQIKAQLQKKIGDPREKFGFKSDDLKRLGDKLQAVMPPKSFALMLKERLAGGAAVSAGGAAQKPEGGAQQSVVGGKRATEQDGDAAVKRAKAGGK